MLDAGCRVIFQYRIFDPGESRFNCLHLVQDINAITLLFNHSINSAHLAFNSIEALADRCFFQDSAHLTYTLWGYVV